jgi:toxin ParE2
LRRFPYSVVYTQDGADILVLAIAHQHRKPNYWKTRLS